MRIPQRLRERNYLIVMGFATILVLSGIFTVILGVLSHEATLHEKNEDFSEKAKYEFHVTLPANHVYEIVVGARASSEIHARIIVARMNDSSILFDDELSGYASTGKNKRDATISGTLMIKPIRQDLVIAITVIILPETSGLSQVWYAVYRDPPNVLPFIFVSATTTIVGLIIAAIVSYFDIVTKHPATLLKQFTRKCTSCGMSMLPTALHCPNCGEQNNRISHT